MVQQKSEGGELAESDHVRILLVGDPGVGKTSLIYCLVNDEFEPNVPPKMANINIPSGVNPDNTAWQIVDYSERDQAQDDLQETIKNANVICIIYSAPDEASLDRVSNYWIPTIRKHQTVNSGMYKPIILVANKTDLTIEKKSLEKVSSIVQEFVDVEAYIEVSALTQKNVVDLFYAAQKSIIYPLAPLFDPQLRVLTKKCKLALINIFKLCDLDGDGLLNDHELNLFQQDCFGTPLQKDALDDLKQIIKQSTMDGIIENSITQMGFLFLHTLSIDKGRHDFTWQVLRKFEYDNQINLKSENLQLVDGIVDDTPRSISISSSQGDNDDYNQSNSDSSDQDSSEDLSLDLSWVREHSDVIKTGLGFTLATLLSILALKYLVRSIVRK